MPRGLIVADAADFDGDDDMAPDPTIPTKGQATARMILIGWKESAVPAEVKRTKAEAKTRLAAREAVKAGAQIPEEAEEESAPAKAGDEKSKLP